MNFKFSSIFLYPHSGSFSNCDSFITGGRANDAGTSKPLCTHIFCIRLNATKQLNDFSNCWFCFTCSVSFFGTSVHSPGWESEPFFAATEGRNKGIMRSKHEEPNCEWTRENIFRAKCSDSQPTLAKIEFCDYKQLPCIFKRAISCWERWEVLHLSPYLHLPWDNK